MKTAEIHIYTHTQRTYITEMLCAYFIMYCSSRYVCSRVSILFLVDEKECYIVVMGIFYCHYFFEDFNSIYLTITFSPFSFSFDFFWSFLLDFVVSKILYWIQTNRSSHSLITNKYSIRAKHVPQKKTPHSGFYSSRMIKVNIFFPFSDRRFPWFHGCVCVRFFFIVLLCWNITPNPVIIIIDNMLNHQTRTQFFILLYDDDIGQTA